MDSAANWPVNPRVPRLDRDRQYGIIVAVGRIQSSCRSSKMTRSKCSATDLFTAMCTENPSAFGGVAPPAGRNGCKNGYLYLPDPNPFSGHSGWPVAISTRAQRLRAGCSGLYKRSTMLTAPRCVLAYIGVCRVCAVCCLLAVVCVRALWCVFAAVLRCVCVLFVLRVCCVYCCVCIVWAYSCNGPTVANGLQLQLVVGRGATRCWGSTNWLTVASGFCTVDTKFKSCKSSAAERCCI